MAISRLSGFLLLSYRNMYLMTICQKIQRSIDKEVAHCRKIVVCGVAGIESWAY